VTVGLGSANSSRLAVAIVVAVVCASLSLQQACDSGVQNHAGTGGVAGVGGSGGVAGVGGNGGVAGVGGSGGVAGVGGNGGAGGMQQGMPFPCVGTANPDAGLTCTAEETFCMLARGGAGATGSYASCSPFSVTPSCPTVESSCNCTPAGNPYYTNCDCTASGGGFVVDCIEP